MHAQSPVADLDPGENLMAADMMRVRPRSAAAAAAAAQVAETLGPTLSVTPPTPRQHIKSSSRHKVKTAKERF